MFQRTLPILALALTPLFAHADDAKQPLPTSPTLVVRLASLHTLFSDIKLVSGMLGKDDFSKQIDDAIKSKLGPKGLFGIDGKRPIGFYAYVGKDISDLGAVLMVPVSSDKKFKEMLEAMDWKVTAGKDGLHTVQQDLLPMDVQYRIANQYAYIGILAKQDELLKVANLLPPEKIFTGKHQAAIALTLRIDQIPADIRDGLLKALTEKLDEGKDAAKPAQPFGATLGKEFSRILGNVFADGEELTLLIDIEHKTKRLTAELMLTAKADSALAKDIKKLGDRKTLFAGVLHKDAALNALLSFEIPPALREAVDSIVNEAMAKVLEETTDDVKKKQAKMLLDALKPSLTSSEIDAAFCLRGPHQDKSFTVVAGFKLHDGNALAAAVLELLNDLPKSEKELLTLNAEKVGKVMIHRFNLQHALGKAKEFVGDHPLYFAFRDNALFVAIGEEGLPAIKHAVAGGPTATVPLRFDLSLARFGSLIDKAGLGQKGEAMLKNGEDGRISFTLEGGAELRLRLTLHLSVLRLFFDSAEPVKEGN
jgi:hypothetical protein